MTSDTAKQLRLQSWFSPAFPIGAFSYSHGLEWAVEDGSVTDRTSLVAWLEADLRHGSGRMDAMLFAQAWRAARAFSAPIESERGSNSLFCRIFSTHTGVHFAGKCSDAAASSPTRPGAGALSSEGRGPELAATHRSLPGPELEALPPAANGACPLPAREPLRRTTSVRLRERAATQSPVEGGLSTSIAEVAPPAPDLLAIAELAAALRGTAELALESGQQGVAFLGAVRKAWPHPELDRWAGFLSEGAITPVLPVVAGLCCAAHEIDLGLALPLYVHGSVANYVNAAVRLVPLGQTDGQIALAALEAGVLDTAREGASAELADIGSAAFMIDIASMRHETQYTRLFRS